MLDVQGLTVKYGDMVAVDRASFSVKGGEVLGVLGINGAGKSTLFRAILGLLPHTGRVSLFGSEDRRHLLPFVGYVPQNMDFEPLFPGTVRDVVRMGIIPYRKRRRGLAILERAGLPIGAAGEYTSERRMIGDALETVGMSDMEDRRIGSLSGGQLQRAFVAQSLVKNPLLVMMDEPVGSMDVESQLLLFEAVRRSVRERGITVIMSMHDPDAIRENSTEVMVLNNRVMYHGETEAFFSDPCRLGMYTQASMYAPDGGAAGETCGMPTKLPDITGAGHSGAQHAMSKVKRLQK